MKVLGVILTVVVAALIVVRWRHGSLAMRDTIGSLVSALIGSYLVHLWLLPADED